MRVIGWFAPYGTTHTYAVIEMWEDGKHRTEDPTKARSAIIYDFDHNLSGVADPDCGTLGRLH